MRVNLTDRFVRNAKAGESGRAEFFDVTVKGLALRVTESGNRSWSYHFTCPSDGKRARVSLGTYPATTLADARTRALEAKGHVERGEDPRQQFAAQAADALTVAGLVESYLAKHVRTLRSSAAIERRIKKNITPRVGSTKLADLSRRDINRIVDPILARGAPTEAARVFEDARAMLRWAAARGDLDHNPMDGMNKPSAQKPRERVLNDEEIQLLWHGLDTSLSKSKQVQRIIKLCLITGQRVGEIAGMMCCELDLEDKRWWLLPGSRTKNGRDHLVPLSDLAIAVIRETLEDNDTEFVFPCGESSLCAHAVARTIGRAHEPSEDRPLGRFGIPHFTAHDLRRTVLSNFARLRIPPIVAGAVANHVSVTKGTITLAVYTRYDYEDEKREALDRWADALADICAKHDEDQNVVPLRRAVVS